MRYGWLLLGVLLGCRSEASPSSSSAAASACPASAAPITEAQFRALYVERSCSQRVDCCNAAGLPTNAGYCRTLFDSYVDAMSRDSFGKPMTFDAIAAGECFCRISEAVEPCSYRALGVLDGCLGVYRGTVPEGGACKLATDCSPDGGRMDCPPPPMGTPKGGTTTCTKVPVAADGEPCSGIDLTADCEPGSYCAWIAGSVNRLCAPLRQLGERCEFGENAGCAPGTTCDPTTSKCSLPLPVGARCTNLPIAWTAECVAGARCATSVGLCTKMRAVGESCASHEECVSYRCSGTCIVAAPPAQACLDFVERR